MATKQSFFWKPETVNEIIGNRRVIPVNESTLVDVVNNLTGRQAVVVDFNIIPDADPIDGTPYWKEEDSQHKSQRFLKRGPQIEVMKYTSLEQAMDMAVLPYIDRRQAIQDANLTIPTSGYGWWGHRDRQHRKVHLTDCVKGAKIFSFSQQNPNNLDRQITTGEYNSDSTRNGRQFMGGDYLFEVPSTSSDWKHDVAFYSVPIEKGNTKFARVLDLGAEQSSRAVTKRVSKRYAGREMYFGAHAIAAYIELAKLEHESGNNIPLSMCPFALPTQKTVDFYNKLERKVMMQDSYVQDGKKRTKKRPLNQAEKEIMLWQFVAKYGPDETFFARGKMQDYKWQRMHEVYR